MSLLKAERIVNPPPEQYWFPAKRYGWGWGFPSTWQGWIVLLAYVAAVGVLSYFLTPRANPFLFFGLLILATICVGLVFWMKGEPPSWRWGKR